MIRANDRPTTWPKLALLPSADDSILIKFAPRQTVPAADLKITAHAGAMFVVSAATQILIEPNAGAVELASGLGWVCGNVSDQLAPELLRHRFPMLFRRSIAASQNE